MVPSAMAKILIFRDISVKGGHFMKLYSYVIPRDYGFAPNPFHGYCTLATCKPIIRRVAEINDWIAAFGPKKHPTEKKLVYLMQVSESLTFDEYWNDERFKYKHPVFNKSTTHKYGDNIYHHVNGTWIQDPSHHSLKDGMNLINLNRDTKTNRVLIAEEFYYFGEDAILLPVEYQSLIWCGRNHGVNYDNVLIEKFIGYIRGQYSSGIHGFPFSRMPGKFEFYKG